MFSRHDEFPAVHHAVADEVRPGFGCDSRRFAFFFWQARSTSQHDRLWHFFDDTLQSEYKIRSLNSQVPQNDWGIMKNALALLLSACCWLGLPYGLGSVSACADVFTLRSGEVIDGQVFRETEKTYMVLVKHLDGQKMVTINKRDVASRTEGVQEEALLVGLIEIKSESYPDAETVATALIESLERSLSQGDDLTLVVIDDLSLDSKGALRVSSTMARAVQNGAKERLVCVLGRCSGPAASVASCFPRVVALPFARLTGPSAGVFTEEQCQKMRGHAEVCHGSHVELVESLTRVRPSFHVPGSGWQSTMGTKGIKYVPQGGRFSLKKDELLATKTCLMACDSMKQVPECLGHMKTSIRTVRPKTPKVTSPQAPSGLAALIPRRITDFNEGLAKAKEGIEILRRTKNGDWYGWSSSYWRVNIKKYWQRDHSRGLIPNSIKKVSEKAQRLIKGGLKKALDAARFLEKQAKHQDNPTLDAAAARIDAMSALAEAVENEIQLSFESKCDAVLKMKPLAK